MFPVMLLLSCTRYESEDYDVADMELYYDVSATGDGVARVSISLSAVMLPYTSDITLSDTDALYIIHDNQRYELTEEVNLAFYLTDVSYKTTIDSYTADKPFILHFDRGDGAEVYTVDARVPAEFSLQEPAFDTVLPTTESSIMVDMRWDIHDISNAVRVGVKGRSCVSGSSYNLENTGEYSLEVELKSPDYPLESLCPVEVYIWKTIVGTLSGTGTASDFAWVEISGKQHRSSIFDVLYLD